MRGTRLSNEPRGEPRSMSPSCLSVRNPWHSAQMLNVYRRTRVAKLFCACASDPSFLQERVALKLRAAFDARRQGIPDRNLKCIRRDRNHLPFHLLGIYQSFLTRRLRLYASLARGPAQSTATAITTKAAPSSSARDAARPTLKSARA
jgi:hypothetical protein